MKSTLIALLMSLAFQGSASAQLRITYFDAIPDSGYWQHAISTDVDGNQGIVFAYDGPCSSTGGHEDPFEGIALKIKNDGPDSIIVQYTMSLICEGSSPEEPEPRIYDPTLNDQVIGLWYSLGRPNDWSGTLVLPAGFDSGFCAFYQMQGSITLSGPIDPIELPKSPCCVNSGCASITEADCSKMGGTWIEGGSCDDCEPVADDCPADVDGDGTIGFSDVLIILNDWGACP